MVRSVSTRTSRALASFVRDSPKLQTTTKRRLKGKQKQSAGSGSPDRRFKRRKIRSKSRSKVRVQVEGVRIWVLPEHKAELLTLLQSEYDPNKHQCNDTWHQVARSLAMSFGTSSWGGPGRKACIASTTKVPDRIKPGITSQANPMCTIAAKAQIKTENHEVMSQCQSVADSIQPVADSIQPVPDPIWLQDLPKSIPLLNGASDIAASYVVDGATACMKPHESIEGMQFTPQSVANFLYQVLPVCVHTLQNLLGTTARFNSDGRFLEASSGAPASGGQVCAWWGTELACRSEQAMTAWDYDVHLCVFQTPDVEFTSVCKRMALMLEPLGLRLIEHRQKLDHPGFKFRIAPKSPLAWHEGEERYQEAFLLHPTCSGASLKKLASESKAEGRPVANPCGMNCVEVEVYDVHPCKNVFIKGTKSFHLSCKKLFPLKQGIFGPLRIPVPSTPAALDLEYGKLWRDRRVVKTVLPNGGFKMIHLRRGTSARRCVWPSMPIEGCPSLRGSYFGVGMDASDEDIVWIFNVNT
jgi:hypothetical protein